MSLILHQPWLRRIVRMLGTGTPECLTAPKGRLKLPPTKDVLSLWPATSCNGQWQYKGYMCSYRCPLVRKQQVDRLGLSQKGG